MTHSGSYNCEATNIVGSTNATLEVGIRGAPPRLPAVTPQGSREMRVAWNGPQPELSGKLLSYVLSYGISDFSERIVVNSIGTSAFISDLEEYTEYLFEISGVYAGGVEGLSINATGVTFEAGKREESENCCIIFVVLFQLLLALLVMSHLFHSQKH